MVQFHFNDFNGCLNQLFTLEIENSEIGRPSSYTLKLISVDKQPNSATIGDNIAFSVVFRGSKEPVMQQRIYRIKHGILGEMELFIVPIGPDDEGMCYEAVFS